MAQTGLTSKHFVLQIAEGGYSFVFLVEEVVAGLPVEGAEFALKRVCLLFSVLTPQTLCIALICPQIYFGPKPSTYREPEGLSSHRSLQQQEKQQS